MPTKAPHMTDLTPGTRTVLHRALAAYRRWIRLLDAAELRTVPSEYASELQNATEEWNQAFGYLLRRLIRLEKGVLHSGVGRRKQS